MTPQEIEQEVLKRLPHPCCVPKEANLDKIIEFFRNEVIEEEAVRRVTALLPKGEMTVDEEHLKELIAKTKQEIIEERGGNYESIDL